MKHNVLIPTVRRLALLISNRSRPILCLLAIGGWLLSAGSVRGASAIWLGATGAGGTNWSVAANWSNSIAPASGDDLIINDTTLANLFLDDSSHTIGLLQSGTNGNRTTAFTIQGSALDPYRNYRLTINNGLSVSNAATVALTVTAPVTLAGPQTWAVRSTTANAGTITLARGVSLASPSGNTNTFVLNGKLAKTGLGMLRFNGPMTLGDGDLDVVEGTLYFSTSGNSPLTVGGTGTITVSNGAKLYFWPANAGALDFTRPVVMNNGSTLTFGDNKLTGSSTYIGAPITWNATNTLSYVSTTFGYVIMTNSWSGAGIIALNDGVASPYSLGLSGELSGFSGRLTHNGIGGGSSTCNLRFLSGTTGSAAAQWVLNNRLSVLETYGAANVNFGELSGSAGTLRNSDPGTLPATATIGQLNTSVTLGANVTDGTAPLGLIKVGTGTLSLTGTNTYSGGTIISNGTVASLSIVGSGVGSGPVTVKNGATFSGFGPSTTSAVTVESGGTLDAPGVGGLALASVVFGSVPTDITTSTINVAAGGQIDSGGGLTVNGTNFINITGGNPPVGVYDLIKYPGFIGGTGYGGFKLGTLPLGMVATLQDSGTAIQLKVTAITIEPIIWVGNVSTNWNLAGQANWKGANTGTPQAYQNGYSVAFNDSSSVTNVSITNSLTPSSVTVSNTTRNYTLAGRGGIAGSTSLVKAGAGTLTLTASNTYSGGTLITNGVLQIGNGSTNGQITGPVDVNGRLVLSRSDAITFGNPVAGTGILEQRGPGTLSLNGANGGFSGTVLVSTGTLFVGSSTLPLGDITGPTMVTNGGTLDMNTQVLGEEPVFLAGAGVGGVGAMINSMPNQNFFSLQYVTLTGPTTLGGVGEWSIRNTSVAYQWAGITGYLQANGNPLTKVGANTIYLDNLGDTALSDIAIKSGNLTFSRLTTFGDPTKTLTVSAGATLGLRGTSQYIYTPMEKAIFATNATILADFSANYLFGSISLSGTNNFDVAQTTVFTVGSAITGNGALNKVGTGTLALTNVTTHTGGTTVNAGTLQVDGTLGDGTKTVPFASGSRLAGNGVIRDAVFIQSGATNAPGAVGLNIGSLTISNSLTLAAGSVCRFDIDPDFATNDFERVTGTLTYGGTLSLAFFSLTPPMPGTQYKLFQAGAYAGAFSAIQPSKPGVGLVWDTSTLSNGILSVKEMSTTSTNLSITVSGSNLVISWPADHLGWRLEYQVNPINVGITSVWDVWPNSENVNSVTIPISPTNPTAFFRLVYP